MEHLLNSCFYYNYFTPIFSNLYFLELLFLVGDRKINKIYQSKLKSADRLWAANYFAEGRFCNSHSWTVSLAVLCALLKNFP